MRFAVQCAILDHFIGQKDFTTYILFFCHKYIFRFKHMSCECLVQIRLDLMDEEEKTK